MADATDWLSAAGGVIGAIGGPAGLWAAWSQHRANRRRQYGPPEELVGLLAKVIDVARDVSFDYRDASWMEASGLQTAIERIDELTHLVRNESLAEDLVVLSSQASSLLHHTLDEFLSQDQRVSLVARQARRAEQVVTDGRQTLERLRRQL
ncbi:hypothetical protein ACWEGX_03040 [Streptomyces chartreusis]